ncbi:IS66-like element accessory protein TnpA [Microvirga tunisiensis]|uniref:Transposase n=1 Tax=Microvirga tunisiensis TaxID=2108360 RepID=A0A5N7MWH9_9HYPH|nr:transposase [Microvirga tunisiensis]MPR13424.1 transposase [Microvirga tunisiensis]MPR31307.1 transposase [Microvirga tunisiensis]
MMRQEILAGMERRRRWSTEEKLQVLSEVGVEGATVADVARRHDVTRQHLYQWRRQMRDKRMVPDEEARFLPVELSASSPQGWTCGAFPANDRHVEIGLRNGRIVRAAADLPENLLMRAIRIAESA